MRGRDVEKAARVAVVAAIGLLGAACHTYVPVERPAPGTTVRVTVPVSSALDNGNAAPRTAAIEGNVVSSGDTIRLAVTNRQEYGAYREIVRYDTLTLAPGQYVSLEHAEFSTKRTIALSTVIAVGVTVGAILAFNKDVGDDSPIDPGPPPPAPSIVVNGSFVSGLLGLLGVGR